MAERKLHSIAFSVPEWDDVTRAGGELAKETGINPSAKEVALSCVRRYINATVRDKVASFEPARPPPGRPYSTTFTDDEWNEITRAKERVKEETGVNTRARETVMYCVRRYLHSRL